MEETDTLKLSLKIQQELNCSRIKGGPNEQVASHCKRDHLSPSPFDERKHVSTYLHSHSPNKQVRDYNDPQMNKELLKFRKHQNSLPTLPSILATSNYQNSFHQPHLETPAKGKQRQGWFMKMNWALDPASNYQKSFLAKDGNAFNKENKKRTDNNHLSVIHLQNEPKRNSDYKIQFLPHAIKRQAEMAILPKDHLGSKVERTQQAISQYQRRYDSLMQGARPKQPFSLYKKQGLK